MPEPLPEIQRVDVDEVKRELEAGDTVVVDVRRPEAYAARHIRGARSIGLKALLDGAHGLSRDQKIVLYCTWREEASAARGAAALRQQGYEHVSALRGGLDAWVDRGYLTMQGEEERVRVP